MKVTPIERLHTVKCFWAMELIQSLYLVEQHMYSVRKQDLHAPQVLVRLRVCSIVFNATLSSPVLKEFFFHSFTHSVTHISTVIQPVINLPIHWLRVYVLTAVNRRTKLVCSDTIPCWQACWRVMRFVRTAWGSKNIPNFRCHKIVHVTRCEE